MTNGVKATVLRFSRGLKVAVAALCLYAAPAAADCATPAGAAGDIIFSSVTGIMTYCNGASWVNMGASGVTSGTMTAGSFCTATSATSISCTTAQIDLTSKVTGILPPANGGTGVANSSTITLGGNLTTSGAYTLTLTTTGNTNVTLPTSGTLVTDAVTTLSSLSSIGTITTGVWNGTAIGLAYGGTGTSTAFTQGSVVFAGASGVYSQDNANFFYDSISHRLGLGTASPTANLTINGTVAQVFGADYTTTGLQSAVSLGAASAVRYAGSSTATFYGIVAGVNGQIINLSNASVYALTLANQSTSEGTAANRIVTGSNSDFILASGAAVMLQYDGAAARWRLIGAGGAPAGLTGYVQYNNGGNLGGDSALFWDNTNKYLGVGTSAPAYNIDAATGTVASTIMHVNASASSISSGVNLGGVTMTTATANQLAYYSGTNTISGTSQMYVGTSGIGIGTATPGATLHVYDTGTGRFFFDAVTASSGNAIIMRYARSGPAAPILDDMLGGLGVRPYNGSAFTSDSVASVLLMSDGAQTATSNPAYILFRTTLTGATTPSERMRISSSGNVGIGTTSPNSKLQVYGGEVQTGTSGNSCASTNAGAIRWDGTNLQYCTGSSWMVLNSGGRWDFVAEDQKTSGTSGGTSVAGWQVRTLNTIVKNTIGATLSSNIFTLPAGTYEIEWDAPCYAGVRNKADLYYSASSTMAKPGTSDFANGGYTVSRSTGRAELTLASATGFYISHYIATAQGTYGLGVEVSGGTTEVYTRVRVKKLQ